MRKEIFEMEQALAKAGYSPHVFEVLYANYFRNEKDLRKRVDKLLEHAIIKKEER